MMPRLLTTLLMLGALLPSRAAEHAVATGDADEARWIQRLALPPLAPTREVIAALPQVRVVRAGLDVAQAREQGLQAGVHEWTLRAGAQERSDSSGTRYTENDVALERNLRWFGKAETDRNLGAAGVAAARSGYADGWHEAVRELLDAWYGWQRARSAARVQTEQTALAQQQLDIAARRVEAGDVPRLDELTAQAERDRMQALLLHHEGQETVLRTELLKRYPGLAADAAAPGDTTPEALQLDGDAAQWVQRIVEHNHETELAAAELQMARLRSERAGQDRRGDPTLGVRAARERSGAENVVGAYVAIPLTGSYRQAEQRAALAQADAAEQRLAQTRQRVDAGAQRAVLQAQHALAAWQRLAAVEQSMARVGQLGMKAYSLGEMTLTEALQSRRAALDAALTAEAARWDALHAVARVLVDAHRLWAAQEEH